VDGTADIEAPTTITTLSDSGSGGGVTEFTGASDASTVDLVNDSGTVQVDYGTVVTFVGSTESVSDESTFNNLTVAGTTFLQSASTINNLDQTNGVTDLDQSGSWLTKPLANTINNITITGGDLNLGAQDVVSTTDESTLMGYIASAYGTASEHADGYYWVGSGITSDLAVTYDSVGIGYAAAADNVVTGLSLTGSQVVLRPTIVGDIDLNGSVGSNDLALLLASYVTPSGLAWTYGDVDYNGSVDANDLALLLANYAGDSFASLL
jgi:hypothetical protein